MNLTDPNLTYNSGGSNYRVYIVRSDTTKTSISAWLPATFSMDVRSDYETPFAQSAITHEVLKGIAGASGISAMTQAMTMQVWQGSSPIEFELQLEFVAENDSYAEVTKPIQDLISLAAPSYRNNLYHAPGPSIDWSGVGTAIKQAWESKDNTETATVQGGKDANTKLDINSSSAFLNAGASLVNSGLQTLQAAGKSIAPVLTSIGEAIKKMENQISIQIGQYLFIDSVVITGVSQQYNTQFDKSGNVMRSSVTVGVRTFVTPTAEDIKKFFIQQPTQTGGN